ncbi:MAG: transglutaminase family protein [Deltaproteobacteria bacterium]|nr:transglutaminase family protein [Deltaproteobacteria bacterium]
MIKKRVIKITIICLSLLFPGLTWGILHYYSGTMDSAFEMTHSYKIVVPEGLSSLTFILTLPEEYLLTNTTQTVNGLNATYSGDPSVEDYTDIFENHYKKFIWISPPQGDINVTLSYTVYSSTDWSIEMPDDEFPFDSSGLPDSVTAFLDPSEYVQSNDPAFINLADSLTKGITTQWEALAALNGWIMENINYGNNPYGYDALSTLLLKGGNCSNYAHIGLALVRAAGIPAKFVHGYSLSKPYTLSTYGDPVEANWGQGSHAWIEVYYPSSGWVPYDPQRDLHHVDTHRVLCGRGIDTESIMGRTSWTFDSVPLGYPMAYEAMDINWIDDSIALSYIKSTDEVDSFSLSSAVPAVQDHIITASSNTGGSILPGGTVGVVDGTSQTFSIKPKYGYQITDVMVDDASQGAISSYTFSDISANHTITVQFQPVKGHGSGSSCLINTIRF